MVATSLCSGTWTRTARPVGHPHRVHRLASYPRATVSSSATHAWSPPASVSARTWYDQYAIACRRRRRADGRGMTARSSTPGDAARGLCLRRAARVTVPRSGDYASPSFRRPRPRTLSARHGAGGAPGHGGRRPPFQAAPAAAGIAAPPRPPDGPGDAAGPVRLDPCLDRFGGGPAAGVRHRRRSTGALRERRPSAPRPRRAAATAARAAPRGPAPPVARSPPSPAREPVRSPAAAVPATDWPPGSARRRGPSAVQWPAHPSRPFLTSAGRAAGRASRRACRRPVRLRGLARRGPSRCDRRRPARRTRPPTADRSPAPPVPTPPRRPTVRRLPPPGSDTRRPGRAVAPVPPARGRGTHDLPAPPCRRKARRDPPEKAPGPAPGRGQEGPPRNRQPPGRTSEIRVKPAPLRPHKIKFSDRDPSIELAITEIAGHLTFTQSRSPPGTRSPRSAGRSARTPSARRCCPRSPSSTPAWPASGCTCAAPPGRSPPTSGPARSTRTPPAAARRPRHAPWARPPGRRPAAPAVGQPRRGPDLPGRHVRPALARRHLLRADLRIFGKGTSDGERRKLGRTVEQFDEVLNAFGMRGRRVTAAGAGMAALPLRRALHGPARPRSPRSPTASGNAATCSP